MKWLVALLALVLAGCAGDAAVQPDAVPVRLPATPDPRETWYMTGTVRDNQSVLFLTQSRPGDTGLGGSPAPLLDRVWDHGEADAASAGFPAGTPVTGFLTYSCQNPGMMTFRLTVWANATQVAVIEHEELFVGTFFPVAVHKSIQFNGTLAGAVPNGSWLSASLQMSGCAMPAVGWGSEWARGFTLNPA